MRLGVKRHCFRARQSLHCLDRRIFIGTVLMKDADRTFAVGIEDQLGVVVESGCVDVITNGERADHFAGVSVHHGHDFAAAAQE